jgi:peptidoglycan hydrolase-like protein with peptidoglycan-binding domain
MAQWIVAPCLDVWLGQVNLYAPNRSKRSDGSIGDARHAATSSQHNPLKLPFFDTPLVRARDFTHDIVGGLNNNWFVGELVKLRDPRIKYIIWNWQIWFPSSGWAKYDGINGHKTHLHISVVDNKSILTRAPLRIPGFPLSGIPSIPAVPPTGRRNLAEEMFGEDVWKVQNWFNRMYPRYEDTPIPRVEPPRFGPQTKRVVMEFQRAVKLAPDGVIGPQTWAAMVREGFK